MAAKTIAQRAEQETCTWILDGCRHTNLDPDPDGGHASASVGIGASRDGSEDEGKHTDRVQGSTSTHDAA
jgi:hypothetical protein